MMQFKEGNKYILCDIITSGAQNDKQLSAKNQIFFKQ